MAGYIKVIAGEMFSGKSTELARLIERALIAGLCVQVLVPAFAHRGSSRDVERRLEGLPGRYRITPVPGGRTETLPDLLDPRALVMAVDEAQFFDQGLVEYCLRWRREGRHVLIAGLDMDFRERPFGSMGTLMCIANDVTKVHAVCTRCRQQDAYISHRLTREVNQVVVGESNYTALCVDCYQAVRGEQAEEASSPTPRRVGS
jgi:thymidine kinase